MLVENCRNIRPKGCVIIYANHFTNYLYTFNLCGILSKWFHLLQFPTKPNGSRKIYGSCKFSERKVQKMWVLMLAIDWNLARYLGKTHCVQTVKKWLENLIIGALIRVSVDTCTWIIYEQAVELQHKKSKQ